MEESFSKKENKKMFKKNLIIGFLAVLVIAGFTSCKQDVGLSSPKGKLGDYTKLEQEFGNFDLAPGMGYFRQQPLPKSAYYQGNRTKEFCFTATQDVKVTYSDAVYNSTYSEVQHIEIYIDDEGHEVRAGIPIKEYSSKKSGVKTFDMKAGEFVRVKISLTKYNPDGGTAAEFYIWAD